MTVRRICEGLFSVETNLAIPGVVLPVRTTLFALESGGLVLHSPVDLSDDDARSIDALGPVVAIVAPSGLHYRFAARAQLRWHDAQVWAPRVVQPKAPDLRIDRYFGEDDWPYQETLAVYALAGAPTVDELVFFHRASQTLVVVDLAFNVLEPKGPLAGLVFRLFGTYRHFDASRLYRRFIRDKRAFSSSLEPVLALPFCRLVVGHGEILEGDDLPARLRAVTRRLCR